MNIYIIFMFYQKEFEVLQLALYPGYLRVVYRSTSSALWARLELASINQSIKPNKYEQVRFNCILQDNQRYWIQTYLIWFQIHGDTHTYTHTQMLLNCWRYRSFDWEIKVYVKFYTFKIFYYFIFYFFYVLLLFTWFIYFYLFIFILFIIYYLFNFLLVFTQFFFNC